MLTLRRRNRDAAVEDYSQAIEINPNYPEAYNNRALLYRQQKKYDTALADLNRAIELNPEDGQTRYNVYFNRGLVYFDLENYDAAAEDFVRAAEIDPQSADALAYYGNIRLQQKDFRTALEYCNRALEIEPRHTLARLCRTSANLQLSGSD